jgi:hypothetical protein
MASYFWFNCNYGSDDSTSKRNPQKINNSHFFLRYLEFVKILFLLFLNIFVLGWLLELHYFLAY